MASPGQRGGGFGCIGWFLMPILVPLFLLITLPLVILQQANGAIFAYSGTSPGVPLDFWYDTNDGHVPLPVGAGCGGSLPGPVSVSMSMPLAARVSSPFGLRPDPFTGGTRCHGGIDFAAPAGTPVAAVADGTVAAVVPGWKSGGFGNLVRLDHGGGVESWYGHLSQFLVRDGQRVRQGEIIGLVGSTGRSTGPHLHLEIRIGGTRVDPALLLGSGAAFPAYRRVFQAMATAYAPASGGSGVPPDRGSVWADPTVIPPGAKLYIPGYGDAVAVGPGGGTHDYRIAVSVGTPEEAAGFGERLVAVYVLE